MIVPHEKGECTKVDTPAFHTREHAACTPMLDDCLPPKYADIVLERGTRHHHDCLPSPRKRRIWILAVNSIVMTLALIHLVHPLTNFARRRVDEVDGLSRQPDEQPITTVKWKSCGKGIGHDYKCANITVPLDYHSFGKTDNRTAIIAVTKRLAIDQEHKVGSLFLNPGGPGGSGTAFVYRRGDQLDKILKGRYDLIGFDPRGINLTRPFTKCFDSKFAAEVYAASEYQGLDLPSNFTRFPYVEQDLAKQIAHSSAGFSAGALQCKELSGDELAFVGTEAVVRDIDYLAKVITGDHAKINFWGFSYGTVIGQYMVQILPPERIGRVVIDGVVNVEYWSSIPTFAMLEGLENIDDVIRSFAESCEEAGPHYCELADLGKDKILSSLDETIDELYQRPVPINGLNSAPGVGVVSANSLRSFIFTPLYAINQWPQTATTLAQAFKGNYTGMMSQTFDVIDPADVTLKDGGDFSIFAIGCADVKPDPNFSIETLTRSTLSSIQQFSSRVGEMFWILGLCGMWPVESKSRYSGTFGLEDGTLETPILIVSNTFDPVTSLASGKAAHKRLGNNSRLLQQNGWGHCSISQVSYCTASKVQDFLLDGKVPDPFSMCEVDQKAFIPFDEKTVIVSGEESQVARKSREELMKAWYEVGTGLVPARLGFH